MKYVFTKNKEMSDYSLNGSHSVYFGKLVATFQMKHRTLFSSEIIVNTYFIIVNSSYLSRYEQLCEGYGADIT